MIKREDVISGVTCREDSTVLEIAKLLRDGKKHHVFVLDFSDKPVGIVSTVDITTRVVAENKNPSTLKASDIMTRNVKVAQIDESYAKAYALMIDLGTYSIPIVDKDGKLIGVLDYAKEK